MASVVAGLEPSTEYFYRNFGMNDFGESWADQTDSFTTLAASLPDVVNQPATAKLCVTWETVSCMRQPKGCSKMRTENGGT